MLSRQDSLLIESGLQDGDEVITSPLPVALPGMALQSAAAAPQQASTPQPTPAPPSPAPEGKV